MKVQSNGKKALDKQAKKALKRSLKKVKRSPETTNDVSLDTPPENSQKNGLKLDINENFTDSPKQNFPNGKVMFNREKNQPENGIELKPQGAQNPTNSTFNHSS